MSQPSGTSRPAAPASPGLSLRGAVDLAAVAAQAKRREQAASGAGAGGPSSGVVVDVSEEQFQSVVEQSMTVPVVVDLWATWCEPCKQLSPVLERLAAEYAGRFLLAKVDVDANPRLGQLFQAQSIPMVVAIVKGQPVPLFQGALPEAQVRAFIDELLKVAEANGVTGRLAVGADDGADAGEQAEGTEPAEPPLPPLPPLHQEAYDAIERGDFAGAADAYERALAQSPADADARVGLAQVNLMRRTEGVDVSVARAAAAEAPADPAAQILVADLDLLGGHVDDAFARLIDAVRITAGDERDQLRVHLVELFDVVGADDPRVPSARRALSAALF